MSSHRFALGTTSLVAAAVMGTACSGTSSGGGLGSGTTDGGGSSSSGSSSSGGGDSGSDPFVGSWVCDGTSSLTFTQPAGAKPQMNPYSTDVTVVSNGDGTQTATGTPADGGASCAIKDTVSGSTANVASGGQSCTAADGVTTVYSSGTSTLTSSTTYAVTRVFTFSGMTTYTPDGGTPEEIEVAGSGTSSGTCTKQ